MSMIAVVALIVLIPGIAGTQTLPVTQWPDADQTVALLSQVGGETKGWELVAEPVRHAGAQWLQGPDEGAEKPPASYLHEWTVAAEFRHEVSGAGYRVDLHRFRTALDAFGAMSLRRDPEVPSEPIPLGGQPSVVSAYVTGSRLHAWRGPFYVQVSPASDNDSGKSASLELGQAVLGKLPLMDQDPPIFHIPPTGGLIPESVKYLRDPALGTPGPGCALVAVYGTRLPGRKLEAQLELLLFDAQAPGGAQEVFAKLAAAADPEGVRQALAALGEGAFSVSHRTMGAVFVMRQGAYVAMLRRVVNAQQAEGTLREIGRNVRLQKPRKAPAGTG